MHRLWALQLLAACLFLLPAGRASAEDKIDKLLEELELGKARFVKDQDAAKQKVLNQFDSLIRGVTYDPRMKAGDRLSLADNLQSERKAFAEKGYLPERTNLVQVGWSFGMTLTAKYRPLSRKFDQVMSACIKAGETERAKRIQADKERFDNEHLPGRKLFVARTRWRGSRYQGRSATLFEITVTEMTGSLFKARAAENTQAAGHPIFDLSGSLDGIRVECKSLTPVQGNIRLARCEGIVLGETLILQLTTASRKGLPMVSFAVLRKQ